MIAAKNASRIRGISNETDQGETGSSISQKKEQYER